MGKLKRSFPLLLVAVLVGGGLVSCEESEGTAARESAERFAAALAELDVDGLALDGEDPAAAQEQLSAVFERLGSARPEVQVGQPVVEGGTAKAPLDVLWKLAGREWGYTTTLELVQVGEEWRPRWAADTLAPGLGEDEVISELVEPPKRADVLGAEGAKLVGYREVLRVGIDKTKVKASAAGASAGKLAKLVGIEAAAYTDQVEAAGPEAFVEAIVLRNDAARTVTDAEIAGIPGAVGITDSRPLAESREFARSLLGTVGEASAEQVEASDGELVAGDLAGRGGLQERYDEQLRGENGLWVFAQPAGMSEQEVREATVDPRRLLFSVEKEAGEPVRTSLDPKLQRLAEKTLSEVGPASSIVALKPSNGEVLAVANGPGSDGYDTALLGQYAPGSIFKTVDALAMLREGSGPETTLECPATVLVEGRVFKNAEGYPSDELGPTTLREAYAHSCNTAFINARDQISQGELESAALSLGVAVEAPALGVDAFLGSVPGEAAGTEHAASMIGQGKILMSPLSAAVMAGSVAKGAAVSPKLVLSDSSTPVPLPSSFAKPLDDAEAGNLKDLMRAVVTSGHAGFLADVPGAPVGAKTGTAEFGEENPPKTHAWIVATQGDLAVAVFVEDGGLGAETSGPLLKEFLSAAN